MLIITLGRDFRWQLDIQVLISEERYELGYIFDNLMRPALHP